ncbi:ImmA/IrrE family metallo-endopeptidase [Candidatus Gottesmanbacteria bacterium]|nr:ImmA/IrrE family metallo-endopeptidase [Candidatus Gottesmanbacteria bacterium]
MKIKINHTVLRKLREDHNIPIDKLAQKLSLSQSEYARYENEDIEVDLDFAERIAGFFNYNWSVFLLNSPPNLIGNNPDNRTQENKTPTLSNKTIKAIEDARFILNFSDSLPNKLKVQLPSYDDIKSISPEELGNKIRKLSEISIDQQEKFNSTSEAFKTWIKFVESRSVFVSQYRLGNEDKVRAFSISENNQAIIVLNSADEFTGRIFSLFHEFCHILRRNAGLCDLHSSKDSDVEVYCNRFAAAFLAPLDVIQNYIETIGTRTISANLDLYVKKIANKLRVSRLVIYRRFTTVNLIPEFEYNKIHNSYLIEQKDFGSNRQAEEIETEEEGFGNYYLSKKLNNGESYTHSIFHAYDSGNISPIEASSGLGISVKNLEKYRRVTAPIY